MDADDADIIRTPKSEKKTLLERYDIPVEHLSYEYISECSNGKKLERIVTILRSGEEGVYPDLTMHAEKRLAEIKPTSIVLRKSEPILKRSMLEPSECKEIDRDINNWTSEMQSRERDLEEGKAALITDQQSQPDIRQCKEETTKKQTATSSKNINNPRRISSCDYAAWDKYDVDTELNKIEIREEQKRAEDKRFQRKQKETNERGKLAKDTIVDKSSLTGTELDFLADLEREKGNEAFRAGDYQEALEHYNTSIRMNSNVNSYNNRAMTYIKLQRYEDALHDCNQVLYIECTNTKALLRRAVALEHLEKSSQALIDYEAVLMLEPTNAVAIAGVKKLRKPCFSRKVRMTIEEENESVHGIRKANKTEENNSWSTKFDIGNSICYCDRAPGPSKHLRPRPHLKANYCFENEINQRSVIKNGSSKKIEFEHRKNTIEFSKNPTSSVTKSKSNTSYTMPGKRGSSVIIEELPNESCNNNIVGNKNKSNEAVENKNKTCDSKKVNASNVKNFNKNHEQNGNSKEKRNARVSPKRVQVADKFENKTSKSEKHISQNFNNIENPYEFMRMWQSLKNDTDLEMHAKLLRSVKIDKLTTVLGNELDGHIFSTILRCVEQHFCTPTDKELVNNLLKSICQVKRFSIVNMFLNAEDKQAVRSILNFLDEHETPGVSSLRQIYCV